MFPYLKCRNWQKRSPYYKMNWEESKRYHQQYSGSTGKQGLAKQEQLSKKPKKAKTDTGSATKVESGLMDTQVRELLSSMTLEQLLGLCKKCSDYSTDIQSKSQSKEDSNGGDQESSISQLPEDQKISIKTTLPDSLTTTSNSSSEE